MKNIFFYSLKWCKQALTVGLRRLRRHPDQGERVRGQPSNDLPADRTLRRLRDQGDDRRIRKIPPTDLSGPGSEVSRAKCTCKITITKHIKFERS